MKKIKKNARCSERRIYQLDAEGSDFMVAQLVDIDFYPRMSEETLAFNATLRILAGSFVCCFDCSNDGHGGCTIIHPRYNADRPTLTERYREVLQRWNRYLNTQRDDRFYETAAQLGWDIGKTGNAVMKSAESEVNELLADWCDRHDL